MNIFKRIISFSYTRQILPFQVLKKPNRISILFPLESYDFSAFIPSVNLLKNKFKNVPMLGVTKKEYVPLLQSSNLFDEIITYESNPIMLSRQFFRLRKKLRTIHTELSIDFNAENDVLTWLTGADLRVGSQFSPFINYRIKLQPGEITEKLAKVLCTGH